MDTNKKSGRRRRVVPRAVLSARLAAVLLFTLVAASCRHEEIPKRPEGPIVARVGNAYLTLAELKASIPAEYSDVITRDQNVLYVRQWINTELLYQEALRLKINEEPDIKARLDRMRKDLLSAEVISRGATKGGMEVSDQAVREYYEANREQFIREYNVVRYEDIVVDDVNAAFEIRRTVTHDSFKNVAKAHTKAQNAGVDDHIPFVALDAIPPKLRNAILAVTAFPSIIGPYGAEDGFHVLRVIGKYDKGSIASIDEVRDEIVSRLSNIGHKDDMERLVSEIRAKSDVEFNVDQIPGVGAVSDGAPKADAPKPDSAASDAAKPEPPRAAAPAPKPATPITPRPAAPVTPRPAAPAPAPAAAPAQE